MNPSKKNGYLSGHIAIVTDSYFQLTGRQILYTRPKDEARVDFAKAIFNAPFALISHGTEEEPVFNYANKTAMRLFNMTWDEITVLPSKYSAETPNREQRAQLLQEVKNSGYIENYSGVRIAKNGRRFYIERATVWNLTDATGVYCGQAAMFSHWRFL